MMLILEPNNIRNIKDFSLYFNLLPDILSEFSSEIFKENNLDIITIHKHSNKFRKVARIKDTSYKLYLKTLLIYLNQIYSPHSSVHGYIKKRNIVTNATEHLHKKIILKFDIKNFFYSISEKEISPLFLKLGFNDEIANFITSTVTFEKILYPGLNTSPLIANLYCDELDKDLYNLTKTLNCKYSRYADDITISGDNVIPTIEEIKEILEKYLFQVNDHKVKIMKMGKYQVVTGLSVFDKSMPRIPRNIKRKLRLAVYLRYKFGSKDFENNIHWITNSYLDSLLIYYAQIEPYFIRNLRSKFPKN